MKGIVLAGGHGTRLYPATLAVCKQLLPVFDKPMIYYPLSTLMQAGIRDILIISTPEDIPRFQKIFGSGQELGLRLQYAVQLKPQGLAQALILAEDFLDGAPSALILGDNIFHGADLPDIFREATVLTEGGLIFGYPVRDPERYGVIHFDAKMRPLGIEEKPKIPKSYYAVPGIYFYGPDAPAIARSLKPSPRGELEITDVNRTYLEQGRLTVRLLGRGHAWLDTGTFEALAQASAFVQAIQERQGVKIACVEEIAFQNGWIGVTELRTLAQRYAKNEYGEYLTKLEKDSESLRVPLNAMTIKAMIDAQAT